MIILIGGPTAIGKTKFVDLLIEKGSGRFARPESYTTRPRRKGEGEKELKFVSQKEFWEMFRRGEFLTVDKAYGNYYAMTKASIHHLLREKKIIVKEIHPKNHKKIKALVKNDVLSVILLPRDVGAFLDALKASHGVRSEDDIKRINEDKEFYSSREVIGIADVILLVERMIPLERILERFYREISWIERMKDIRYMEKVNIDGYDAVATEFDDTHRITTANFHDLSYTFFESQIEDAKTNLDAVLDVGSGRGFLLEVLRRQTMGRVTCLDSSIRMLISEEYRDSIRSIRRVAGSAWWLPFKADSFSLLTASLADPFLNYQSLQEMRRVLRPGGTLLLSIPTNLWAKTLRAIAGLPSVTTEFRLSSGDVAQVVSLTYSESELKDMLKRNRLEVVQFQTVYAGALRSHKRPISPAISIVSETFRIPLDELPLLYLVRARAA